MKNYEDMSDFEINCRVHAEIIQISGLNSFKAKDYCNNPDDAWPIIVDNKISLTCHQSRGEWSAVFNADNICFHANNPLRAAMIVFLKMNEDKL